MFEDGDKVAGDRMVTQKNSRVDVIERIMVQLKRWDESRKPRRNPNSCLDSRVTFLIEFNPVGHDQKCLFDSGAREQSMQRIGSVISSG